MKDIFTIMCTGGFNFWVLLLGWLKWLININSMKARKWAYSSEILYIHIKNVTGRSNSKEETVDTTTKLADVSWGHSYKNISIC